MKRIRWQYLHSLNSISRVYRIKEGVYFRKIHHRRKYDRYGDPVKQMAVVHFDGNKCDSIIPFDELEFIMPNPVVGVALNSAKKGEIVRIRYMGVHNANKTNR